MLDALLTIIEGIVIAIGVPWILLRLLHAFPPVSTVFTGLYLGFAGFALIEGRIMFSIVLTVLWLLWIAPGMKDHYERFHPT